MEQVPLQRVKAQLWSTLLALGFSPQAYAPKLKITMNSFDQNNVSALEHVIYFLFLQIDKEKAETDFRFAQPCSNHLLFRKITMLWLQQLQDDGIVPRLLNQPGLLTSASGHRVYELLWKLASFALSLKLKAEFPFEQKIDENIPKEILLVFSFNEVNSFFTSFFCSFFLSLFDLI